jgi:TolB protein
MLGRRLIALCFLLSSVMSAETRAADPPNEDVLGEIVVTGTSQEHIPKIAVLPSTSPAYEDVIVRGVVRRDLEISGFFKVIPDKDAPPGAYRFTDPVDVAAWQARGAEAIVKVAAQDTDKGKIEVLGIAYFPNEGADPVYQTKLTVNKDEARRTAHKITDDLIGALTGFPGGFSSRFTYSGAWARNRRIFSADSDGFGLTPNTDPAMTALAPAFGPGGRLYFSQSANYLPYRLFSLNVTKADSLKEFPLPFRGSIYGVAFNKDRTKIAISVANFGQSAIYVGTAGGTDFQRVSNTELATHPAFSPSGKLAWIGGSENGSQRLYVDGKPISPAGFTAASPAFCDTEDGTFVVYAVQVGGGKFDIVMSNEKGQGMQRLTQNQGSNTYPACSPDGRMLAFFRETKEEKGLYVLSLKRWTTTKILGSVGESLRWDPLEKSDKNTPSAPKQAGQVKSSEECDTPRLVSEAPAKTK